MAIWFPFRLIQSMSSVPNTAGSSRTRAALVFTFCALYLFFQVCMIVRGYFVTSKHFAFWMFPESTYFQATLNRVLTDGREVITSDGAWGVRTGAGVVEYHWQDFVNGYKLDRLGVWERSKGTFDDTLKYFQAALDYVAERIHEDVVTHQLVLRIEYERAGELPRGIVLASRPRSGGGGRGAK